jgi:trans-aconitate methyltransferase
VASWLVPTNAKELRSFLRLAGYYRKFMHHFEVISRPLTELLKKNVLFIWIPDHDKAFNTLKSALVSTRVLALLDIPRLFVLKQMHQIMV